MEEIYKDFEKIGQIDMTNENAQKNMGLVDIYKRRIEKDIKNLRDLERPLSEPETVGTWKGSNHSHIILNGATCEIIDSSQWEIIQEKIKELQNLIKINIIASFFYIDGSLNKK